MFRHGTNMASTEIILIIAALLLLLSVFASKVSSWVGVPSLLIFLALGMLAGSDGPGGIHFEDFWLAQFVGVIALVLILFAGGLETKWASVRPVLGPGLALSTAGVLLTALLVGGFAATLLGFSAIEGLLLGAIVSSTDAAAVFSILRSRNVSLRPPLKPLLELESGSNDPMAVFLTVGLVQLHTSPDASLAGLLLLFGQQMILGGAIGYGVGRLMVYTLNRARLEHSGLYPVLTLGLVMLAYSGTAAIGGNGFLAVYVAGIVLGNARFIHKTSLLHFHDGMAWLMQITMFLVLGLLVFPSRLLPIAGTALLVAAFQVLLARPLATFLTLLPFRFGVRENAMIAWVGLRGAVPIVLATFPFLAGVQNAETIFNVVFFTVLVSVLVQGTSIVPVAKLLGVHTPLPKQLAAPLALEHMEGLNTDLMELIIPPNAEVVGKAIVSIGLPAGSLISMISRDEQFFVPRGDTVLAAGDVVLVLADHAIQQQVGSVLLSTKPSRR